MRTRIRACLTVAGALLLAATMSGCCCFDFCGGYWRGGWGGGCGHGWGGHGGGHCR